MFTSQTYIKSFYAIFHPIDSYIILQMFVGRWNRFYRNTTTPDRS